MFSRALRKTYNANKYAKLSDLDPRLDFWSYASYQDFTVSSFAKFLAFSVVSLCLYNNTAPLYEIFTHFPQPARKPQWSSYPSSITNANVTLIERMQQTRELRKYLELNTAFYPEDYA